MGEPLNLHVLAARLPDHRWHEDNVCRELSRGEVRALLDRLEAAERAVVWLAENARFNLQGDHEAAISLARATLPKP